ncbi:MAG: hypothetical protein ACRDRT_08790, partial [Pseudonocardiaceae bacterium]
LERIGAVPVGLRETGPGGTIDPASVPPLEEKDRIPGSICRVDHQIVSGFSVSFCSIIGCWP